MMRRALTSSTALVGNQLSCSCRWNASADAPPPPPSGEPPSTSAVARGRKAAKQPDVSETAAALLTAVRARNLHAAQAVLGQHWQDQYAVYVLCVLLVLVVYYTTASSMRHTTRRCQAVEHRCREELNILRETMRGTMERWGREMVQRDEQMMDIQRQNMTMTRTVDQMTFALKQCAPRGFTA